ncbi:ATP-binding protein [Blastococcus sp. TF02-09]|uniref:ATP-binding protein n=1 Tax=Blastococcus sp. TF02-09 TaxID=2250576 RepID=UPI000DE8E8AA|nr:ATP-binding protein [Blastococcus sp. TF02-9]RBY80340.1 ATP-binding protein [Blastococcus sp. TF02-9]
MSSRNAVLDLPPMPRSVRTARRLLLELMQVWRLPHDPEDGALVTELVSNVIDHVEGRSELTLEISAADDWLRIAVVDGSAIRPVVRELSMDQPRGRGMRMVEEIADRWGVEDHRGGKRVWCDLRPPGM